MDPASSITHWIKLLQAGDEQGVAPMWEHFFTRLIHLARQKLRGGRRAADEEDVAVSAFNSVCLGLEHGRFPQILSRDSLWRLLVVVTERKAVDWLRQQGRQKRGGGKVLGESALDSPDDSSAAPGVARLADPEPDPALAAIMAEECQRLLDLLDDPMRELALLKLEGYSNEEIAHRQGVAQRTVQRKLELIRSLWEPELQH